MSDEAQDAAAGHTITALELKEMIDAGKDFALIDVREPNEYEIVSIPGATLIPKDRILSGEALAEIPQDKPVVLHCKSGVRSAEALAALHKAGFRDAVHVGGGVLVVGEAWSTPPCRPTDLLTNRAEAMCFGPVRRSGNPGRTPLPDRPCPVHNRTGRTGGAANVVGDPLRPSGWGDGGRTDGRRWTAMRPARVRPGDCHD